MKTDYYCKSCKEFFVEETLPNINKTHHCGSLARVVWHEQEGAGAEGH